MIRHLIIDGVDICEKYSVVASEISAHDKPDRNLSFVGIDGRNGDVLIDNENLENKTVEYSLVVFRNYEANFNALMGFLYSRKGYVRIEEDVEFDTYREGVFLGGVRVSDIVDDGLSCKIEFSCKPQRFLKRGEEPVTYASGNGAEYISDTLQVKIYTWEEIEANLNPDITLYDKWRLMYGYFHDMYSDCRILEVKMPEDVGSTRVDLDNFINDWYTVVAQGFQTEANPNMYVMKATHEKNFAVSRAEIGGGLHQMSVFAYTPLRGGSMVLVNRQVAYADVNYTTEVFESPVLNDSKPLIMCQLPLAVEKRVNATIAMVNGIRIRTLNTEELQDVTNICVDCETGDIYTASKGELLNMAPSVERMPILPPLYGGRNEISYNAECAVTIIPRWWRV